MGMEFYRAQSSSPLGEDTLKGWRVGIEKYLFRIPCASGGVRIAAAVCGLPRNDSMFDSMPPFSRTRPAGLYIAPLAAGKSRRGGREKAH